MNRLRHLSPAVRRYIVIGVSIYVFELLIIYGARLLGASNLVAVGLSFWLGLIVSFILQKIITFGDKRFHRRVLIPQLVAFSLLVLINFGFTLLITQLLGNLVSPFVARTIALGITTLWNFYLYKTKIFKEEEPAVY